MHTKLAFVIPTCIGIFLTSILACNDVGQDPMINPAQVELDNHRAEWERTSISGYTYQYTVLCECPYSLDQPVKVAFDNGKTKSVAYVESGETPVTVVSPRLHSINGLFDMIQDAITNEVDHLTVRYDSEDGYPTNIEIDYVRNSIDDKYTIIITAFSVFHLRSQQSA